MKTTSRAPRSPSSVPRRACRKSDPAGPAAARADGMGRPPGRKRRAPVRLRTHPRGTLRNWLSRFGQLPAVSVAVMTNVDRAGDGMDHALVAVVPAHVIALPKSASRMWRISPSRAGVPTCSESTLISSPTTAFTRTPHQLADRGRGRIAALERGQVGIEKLLGSCRSASRAAPGESTRPGPRGAGR